MSKPRYNWWGFALAMIRDYPHRQKELKEMHEQKATANLNARCSYCIQNNGRNCPQTVTGPGAKRV